MRAGGLGPRPVTVHLVYYDSGGLPLLVTDLTPIFTIAAGTAFTPYATTTPRQIPQGAHTGQLELRMPAGQLLRVDVVCLQGV